MTFNFLMQNLVNALQWGSFYALIALGYTLVYGVLRLINFAHGDIFMVGAYIAFFVATFALTALGLPGWAALALTIPLTMILTSCVGVALERVAYRPLRQKGAHRLYVVITALMCGLILENGNLALLGASRKAFPSMITETVYNIGGVSFTNLKVAVIIAPFLFFFLLQTIVTRTRVGMAMRAISYDKFAIPLMGIPMDNIIVITFVLGSGFAGLAGLLFALGGWQAGGGVWIHAKAALAQVLIHRAWAEEGRKRMAYDILGNQGSHRPMGICGSLKSGPAW